jgi:putative hydrolase of the HAD superfamily
MARAEQALHQWLDAHAPGALALYRQPEWVQQARSQAVSAMSDKPHDFSAMRRSMIGQALVQAGEDTDLATPAFEVFFAARQQVTLFYDALETLDFLAQRFPLAALTNGNADVQRVGLGAFFLCAVSAHEMGIAKPDPRIFWHTAERLNLAPEAVLHVGDDAALDILGARAAGMPCVWLNRQGAPWVHDGPPPWTVSSLRELVHHFQT